MPPGPDLPRRACVSLLWGGLAGAVSACTTALPATDWTETLALEAARSQHDSYASVAGAMMALGEYDLALRAYTRAIGEDGLNAQVISGIGAANAQLDRMGQAHRYLQRGTRVVPDAPAVWNNLGVVLWHSGEAETARASFAVADTLSPKSHPAVDANIRIVAGEAPLVPPKAADLVLRHRSKLYLIVEA